jgi:hypothetical protein
MAYNPINVGSSTGVASSQSIALQTDQGNLTTPLNVTIQEVAGSGSTGATVIPTGLSAGTIYATASSMNVTAIKSGPGRVLGWYVFNNGTSANRLVFYNIAAASVNTGSSAQHFSVVIPASSGANVSFPSGINFDTAITIAMSSNTTSSTMSNISGAGDLVVTIFYK